MNKALNFTKKDFIKVTGFWVTRVVWDYRLKMRINILGNFKTMGKMALECLSPKSAIFKGFGIIIKNMELAVALLNRKNPKLLDFGFRIKSNTELVLVNN